MTLALLGLMLGIPILELVRRVKVGEFEAEIAPREVRAVEQKVKQDLPALKEKGEPVGMRVPGDTVLDEFERDEKLGLAKLRMELEWVIRLMAKKVNLRERLPLSHLVRELAKTESIPRPMASVLEDVIGLCNRALHGESIRTSDAKRLVILGVEILGELYFSLVDKVLRTHESREISQEEMLSYQGLKYMVTTITPLVKKPILNVRILDQAGIDMLLDGYGEYAEFLIEIKPIRSKEVA